MGDAPLTLKRKRGPDDSFELVTKRAHKLVSSEISMSTTQKIAKDVQNGAEGIEHDSNNEVQASDDTAPGSRKGPTKTRLNKNDKKPRQPAPLTVKAPRKPRPKIVKLAPRRPFPTVPTSSNATGPKSKRKEGNNMICVTRRTELGAYLRQCRDLFVKYDYKEIRLAAMGAAIPHAVMLATSLPTILPYDQSEIKTKITTGSVTVMDEVIPEDEDDEGGTQNRTKGSVDIVISIAPSADMVPSPSIMDEDSFSD